jgi:hypothetical protein
MEILKIGDYFKKRQELREQLAKPFVPTGEFEGLKISESKPGTLREIEKLDGGRVVKTIWSEVK